MPETIGEGRCKGCGSALPEREPGRRGRTRLWCGDNCRRRTWDRERYRTECSGCGADIDRRKTRCRACFDAERRAEHEEVLAFVEWAYKHGLSYREIAEELGWKTGSVPGPLVDELRKAGRIGYRYKAYEQRVAA